MNTIYTDRSRYLEGQRCPRGRYYAYELAGRGIAPVKLAVPLVTGQCVHVGVADLMLHPGDVDAAVRTAVAEYEVIVRRRGLAVEALEATSWTYLEQRALVEALVRAYAERQLPELLRRYRVLEVEQEDVLPMGAVRLNGSKVPLVWMSRPDALLQERETGDLYVQSLKTAASYDGRREAEASHDVQGLSEVAAVEERLAGWAASLEAGITESIPNWFRDAYAANGRRPPRVMGVRMEYLLKGERREDKFNPGRWVQSSPLIRGWRRQTITGWDYAWRSPWTEEDPATGEIRTRRLGRDWQPFNVWECGEVGGIKGWVGMLASGAVQPEAGDCLAAQFVVPVPYFRNQQETEDWFEQAAAQESHVAAMAAAVEAAAPAERRSLLNRFFPQHRRSCDWPTRCPYQQICFGSDQVADDPIASGLYVWREPHHEPERQQQFRLAA